MQNEQLTQQEKGYTLDISDTHGISFNRSGRHWLSFLLELYHGAPVLSDFLTDNPTGFNHHLSFYHDKNLVFTAKRILYLHRNPIDVMFSLHKLLAGEGNPDVNETYTTIYDTDDPDVNHIEERLRGWVPKWSSHVVRYVFEPPSECQERLIVPYEELRRDTVHTLARVVEFIWPGRKAEINRCRACAMAVDQKFVREFRKPYRRIVNFYDPGEKKRFVEQYSDLILRNITDERIFQLYPTLKQPKEVLQPYEN